MHLCGPEAGFNSEIISAGNDKEQASVVFTYVDQIINLSPRLRDILKVVNSTKRVVYHGRGNVYRAISAEAGTKHGMNPTVVIFDELAQAKNRDLFDALETAQGAQPEPLFITISTQSHDPQHPLSQLIDDALTDSDDRVVCHLYEVPDDADIFDERTWIGANPALGDFRSVEDLRLQVERAKRLPSFENTVRNYFLNQRVSQLSTLFSRSLWDGLRGEVVFGSGEPAYLAVDLANTTDLAALAMVSKSGDRLKVFFWKPEELMAEHGRNDRVDYELWLRQGFMEKCPGKVIAPRLVARKIMALCQEYNVIALAYDRWRFQNLVTTLGEMDFTASEDDTGDLKIVPWGQGYGSMAPAIDAFEEAGVAGTFRHDGNPVLNWNIGNAIIDEDNAGNRRFNKEKSRMRIDGAVAAAMAFGLRAREAEVNRESVYQTRGLLGI